MKYYVLALFLSCYMRGMAQNVGINTINPEVDLDIRSAEVTEDATLRLANPNNSRFLELFSGNATFPDPVLLFPATQSLLFASDENNFTERLRISPDGNIGIGINDPQATLDIKGGKWDLVGGSPGDIRVGTMANNLRIGVATGGGGAGDSRIYSSRNLYLGANSSFQIWLDQNGNTGFGASDPEQKVEINGKIKIGDDATAPSEGTIRFNATSKLFEGYDGTKWINLGSQASSSTPYFLPEEEVDRTNMPSFFGTLTGMAAHDDLLVLRYQETSTSDTRIFLLQENGSAPWTLRLDLSTQSLGISSSLGSEMKLNGNRLLLSNPSDDNVREYRPTGSTWSLTHTFTPPTSPGILDEYGKAIDISGEQTIIGNPGATEGGINSGAAYIYNSDYSLAATMLGQGRQNGDTFGSSVALNETRAVAGAPNQDNGVTSNAGSITIYNKVLNNWSANQTFYSNTPTAEAGFGKSIDLQELDFLYVGDDLNTIESYAVENGFWTYKETLEETDGLATFLAFKNQNANHLFTHTRDLATFQPNYITLYERSSDNLFTLTKFFIDGTNDFDYFAISENRIYLGIGPIFYINL